GGTVSPPQIEKRYRLGWLRRPGIDVAVGIGMGTLYLRTTRYDDGQIAEIWVNYSADQGIVQALLGSLCKTANIALQSGVPLRKIIGSWLDSKYEPGGMVSGHPYIKTCTSIVNLMARLLDYHELGNTDHLNIQPAAQLSRQDEAAIEKDMATSPESYAGVTMTGEKCPACGSQRYVHSGAGCKKCLDCGVSGGCG
ncbi:MAG: hypothetical protein FWD53_08180, partial [Phycisphaerales bacterium]|nr:hypothetical protein [Phycisphaerales bacterium]